MSNKGFNPSFDGATTVGDAIQVPMEKLVRKGPGMAAAEAMWLGVAHIIEPNTTLNQVHDILPNVHYTYGVDKYCCRCFGIGVKGYQPGVGSHGQPKKTPYISDPSDLELYYSIPFSLRKFDNLLTPEEEKDLRLKKRYNKDGIEYMAYYAHTVDTSESIAGTYTRKVGELIPKEYEYTSNNLKPTPKLPPDANTPHVKTASFMVITPVKAHLSAFMVSEIKNVCRIIFGEELEISEISLIQAAERSVDDTTPTGEPYQRKELIDAQVGMSGSTSIPIPYTVSDIPSEYRLGASEPLYTSTPA